MVVFALVSMACASVPCPQGRVCGQARWSEFAAVSGDPAIQVHAQAHVGSVAVPGVSADLAAFDALRVSPRRVFLRFGVRPSAGWTLSRAVLALAPHPAWRPSTTPVHLLARGVRSPWSPRAVAEGYLPVLSEDTVGVTLPAGLRCPARIDVTPLFRGGIAETMALGIALETDRGEAVFVGTAANDRADRPHLEIMLR